MIWIGLLLLAAPVALAEAPRFKFEQGQELKYRIVQETRVVETLIDNKSVEPKEQTFATKHTVVRQWKVAELDAQGNATLQMSILSMKWERTSPNGESELFDSTRPEDLKDGEMGKLIGTVLAVVKLDATGKLLEVKEAKFGTKSRFMADLPFKLVLPDQELKVGLNWERPFTLQLDPPQGTGETHAAIHRYQVQGVADGRATINIATLIKEVPTDTDEYIPLLPMLIEGDVYLDVTNGRYLGSRLNIKKELKNHAGEGTGYHFSSSYVEELQE
jgi:hypothetical protein